MVALVHQNSNTTHDDGWSRPQIPWPFRYDLKYVKHRRLENTTISVHSHCNILASLSTITILLANHVSSRATQLGLTTQNNSDSYWFMKISSGRQDILGEVHYWE